MSKYFEATGETKKAIFEYLEKINIAIREAKELCKKHGAKCGYHVGGFGLRIAFKFEKNPDPKVWKPKRHQGYYEPKLSSKLGKEISKQVEQIQQGVPINSCSIIGMSMFDGNEWHTPGFNRVKGKAIVVTTDKYEPKGKFKKTMKRISDLQFEKLTSEN